MSVLHRHRETLRPLTENERRLLTELSRSRSEPVTVVIRSQQILAISDGAFFKEAALQTGRRSSLSVSKLVRRFNREGLEALFPKHGGGAGPKYDVSDREKIVELARSIPDRENDGTANWTLITLRQALQNKGYTKISLSSIWTILREAGFTWQNTRTWCDTGVATRIRKSGVVKISDPDTEAKKTHH